MLSERIQKHRTIWCMIPFVWSIQNRQSLLTHPTPEDTTWNRRCTPSWVHAGFLFTCLVSHLGRLEKLKKAVGVGRSLPPRLFHETHLSITVSSNPISYLTASFQEEKYPDCQFCCILLVKVNQNAGPFKEREYRPAPHFLRVKQCKCSRGKELMAASLDRSSQSFRVISRNFKGSLPRLFNSIPRKNEICL